MTEGRGLSAGEQFIDGIFASKCRGCAGGFGYADNAHTRDEHCQFRSEQSALHAVLVLCDPDEWEGENAAVLARQVRALLTAPARVPLPEASS